jgi:hypothetical protein
MRIQNPVLVEGEIMTDTDGKTNEPQIENSELNRIYRSTAGDETPPHLDEIVLNMAAAEVRRDRSYQWFLPWRRPAAFVAAVGLSLAILIEFDESDFLFQDAEVQYIDGSRLSSDRSVTTLPDAPDSPANLPEISTEQPSNARDAVALDRFSSEATMSSERMREIGQTAEHQSLGNDPNIDPDSNQGDYPCSTQKTENPSSWLECIDDLRANGFGSEADNELERLILVFPETTLLLVR